MSAQSVEINLSKEQIDGFIQDQLCEMIKNNPAMMAQHMLIQFGRMLVEAGSVTSDMKTAATLEGQRYEITCKIKTKKIKG